MKINFQPVFLIYLTGFFLLGGLFLANSALAQTYFCESDGWIYSDTIGWISVSCETYPPDPAYGSCDDPLWQAYGVKIDLTGNLLGYAWNGWVGWIDFSPQDTSPDGTVNPAKLNFETNQVTGWARIISLTNLPGGGWISLNCQNMNECGRSNYKVEYKNCEFEGWAWSDDIGWICFNCETDPNATCTDYPDYRVRCGLLPEPFELLKVSLNGESPCSIIDLMWEESPGVVYYDIYRNNQALIRNLYSVDNTASCPAGENCVVCAFNSYYGKEVCEYHDGALGYPANLGPPEAETEYSYRIEAQGACGSQPTETKSVTTTICPPVLSVLNRDECCITQSVTLQWTVATGRGGTEGADKYILYQAKGGEERGEENYQKVTEFPAQGLSEYSWTSPSDDPETTSEDPFVFRLNTHFYYFIRAVNLDGQNVDSNREEVCCLSGQ